jgi:Uncharacterized conserved protein (COG2071)
MGKALSFVRQHLLHFSTSNRFVHPRRGVVAALVSSLANSARLARLRRTITTRIPFLTLESDVTDVVYMTWMLDADKLASLTPPGTQLWTRDGLTPFTILTYRHGNFGPSMLGKLRVLFPSPLQSNWRLYLAQSPSEAPRVRTVLFLKNVMSSAIYALGTRVFSDALATHLPKAFDFYRDAERFQIDIISGEGSSPSLQAQLRICTRRELPPTFRKAFTTWDEAANFLASQDAAVNIDGRTGRLAFAEIDLPFDGRTIQPLELDESTFRSEYAASFGTNNSAMCFLLPRVKFRALSERLLGAASQVTPSK